MRDPVLAAVVAVSTLVALWLVARLWRSQEHLFFKIALTACAFIPVLGPVMVLLCGVMPPVQPPFLRDLKCRQADVYDRWRHVFEAKHPVKRFRRWRRGFENNGNL